MCELGRTPGIIKLRLFHFIDKETTAREKGYTVGSCPESRLSTLLPVVNILAPRPQGETKAPEHQAIFLKHDGLTQINGKSGILICKLNNTIHTQAHHLYYCLTIFHEVDSLF